MPPRSERHSTNCRWFVAWKWVMKQFIQSLPAGSRAMTGYLTVGSLQVAQPFTDNLRRATQSLRIPRGASQSAPYNNVRPHATNPFAVATRHGAALRFRTKENDNGSAHRRPAHCVRQGRVERDPPATRTRSKAAAKNRSSQILCLSGRRSISLRSCDPTRGLG